MKFKHALILIISSSLLIACSDKETSSDKQQATSAPAATTPQSANTAVPAGHPDMNSPEMQKRMQQAMQRQQQNPNPPQVQSAGEGKVVKVMHAAGYTYMEVDLGDRKTWVAATSFKIKSGDTVKWQGASVMQNFTSKSLHRTFDEILFVSNASKG